MDRKQAVRDNYGKLAQMAPEERGQGPVTQVHAEGLGYDADQLQAVPEGADLGLGCGNPLALADLRSGEAVLDLGSGAGLDCFLAAQAVGPTGRVIGVDMTPEMVERARANAASAGAGNVEFRLGEIESLPVAEGEVDVVISNCVINLVPDKGQAFAEAYRVLRPGGRLHVSDIVLGDELPEAVLQSVAAYVNCVAGAVSEAEYLAAMAAAGFAEITVATRRDAVELLNGCCAAPDEGACGCGPELPEGDLHGLAWSITVSARKPA